MKQIRLYVKEKLQEINMTQSQLAKMTGIRPASISGICRNTGTSINIEQLERIAEALEIKDIRELIDFAEE